MFYKVEFLSIYGLIFTFGLFLIFSVRQRVLRRAFSDRIEQDGGSAFLGRHFMEFGYWVIKPLTYFCVTMGISPNLISLICLMFGLISGVCFGLGYFFEAGLMGILSGLMDALDGRVARAIGKQKLSGVLLDSTVDRVCEMAVGFGLIYYYRDDGLALIVTFAMLLGAVMTSYTTAKSESLQVKGLPRGVMRRGERATYISIAAIFSPFLALYTEPSFVEKPRFLLMLGTLILVALGSLYSSVKRNIWLYKHLS